MKKQIRTLTALGLVLLVLIGAYAGIRLGTRPSEGGPSDATQADGGEKAFEADAASVLSIEIRGVTYEKTADGWTCPSEPALEMNGDKLNALVSTFLNLRKAGTAEGTAPDQVGLATPETVRVSDGSKTYELQIGSKNTISGTTYFRVGGDDTVYYTATDIGTAFDQSMLDLVRYPGFPELTADDVRGFSIERPQGNIRVDYYPSGRPQLDYSQSFTYFLTLEDGRVVPGSEEKIYDVQGVLAGIKPNGCVSFQATDEEKEAYGLTDAPIKLTVGYEGGSYELWIGNEDETGLSNYAWMPGTSYIYTVDITAEVNIEAVILDNLISRSTGYVALISCNDLDITSRGKNWHVDVIPLSEEEAAQEKAKYRYEVNGEKVDAYDFTLMYMYLADPTGETMIPAGATVSGEPELSIRLSLKNNKYFKEAVIGYIPYDDNYYAIVVNGEPKLLANKLEVWALMDRIEETLDK